MDVLSSAISQGLAPAIVVAIYLIITKIIDNHKENTQIKLTTELTEAISTISNFVITLTKNIIDKDKEKCKKAIEDSMFSSGMRLLHFVATTIVNNHIDHNKENILSNIKNIVTAEYYSVYSTLSLFTINNIKPSDYLNKDWIPLVEQDLIDIIYNNSLNKEDKILTFSNKINIRFQSYITYIFNNTIKN